MMNKQIRRMIDEIFADMKMTADNLALRDEMMANAQARFEDSVRAGKTEEEAFAEVAASLGDVQSLLHVGGDEMLNSSDILRGYTDTIILAQLAEGDSYGYVISKNVQEITRGELQLKEATLYTTFRRLEAAGMIESYWGNENAGARRRYYHLTEKGRALFAENQADWRKYRAVISELFGMEDASR